jgi:hypothetical protein
MIFDARDTFEIFELFRTLPNLYSIKMYKYTQEEFKARQDELNMKPPVQRVR